MAELILPENRHLYLHVLDAMHVARFELFFDGLGWDPVECGLDRPQDKYDKDQFDKDDTVYIIERMPETGEVVGFCRINPTTSPHMMDQVFADYCEYDGVPIGASIHEVSRLGYDYRVLKRNRDDWKEVRFRMTSAISEYCLLRGIDQVTYCVHDHIFNAIQQDTWGAIPLGNQRYDKRLDQFYQAGISDITREGLERCRAELRRPEDDVLTYFGPVAAAQLKEAA